MRGFLKYRLHESLVNEMGDGNLPPYKWTIELDNTYEVTINFTTDSDIIYELILGKVSYEDEDVPDTISISFSIISDMSAYAVPNMGEVFRVMATIKNVLVRFIDEWKPKYISWMTVGSKYGEHNASRGNEQRDMLYTKYIIKNIPNAKVIDKTWLRTLIQIKDE